MDQTWIENVSTVKEKKVAIANKDLGDKGKKGGPAGIPTFFQNLFQAGLYKRNQGRITRQVTFAAIAIAFALGTWRMSEMANQTDWALRFAVPGAILAIGAWFAYRMVNLPSFADFLISVEAEMSKVSWPTRTELVRGSVVVLITIIFLAFFLFCFDLMWTYIFKLLQVVPGK